MPADSRTFEKPPYHVVPLPGKKSKRLIFAKTEQSCRQYCFSESFVGKNSRDEETFYQKDHYSALLESQSCSQLVRMTTTHVYSRYYRGWYDRDQAGCKAHRVPALHAGCARANCTSSRWKSHAARHTWQDDLQRPTFMPCELKDSLCDRMLDTWWV